MDKKHWIIIIAIIVVAIAGIYWFWSFEHQKNVKLVEFAQCIKKSGAVFYGAFWCPHCQSQKRMFETFFESAADDLPYVECSTPDSNGQLEVCKKENIQGYPTWRFADGSQIGGEVSFAKLAEKTGCVAPQ